MVAGTPEPGHAAVDHALAGLAHAVLADAEAWVVCRAVRDDAGRVVDFEYLLANAAAEAIVKLGPLPGRLMLELVPEVAETTFPIFVSVVESGVPRDHVTPNAVRGPVWSAGWTAMRIRSVGDLLVVQWHDATGAYDAAAAERRNEARLSALLQNAGEVIAVFTADGTTPLYLSPSTGRVLGRDEVAGGITARVHVEDRPLVEATLDRLVAGGRGAVAEVQVRLQHSDGRWLWVHARGTNHVDDPDVGGIVLNLWDVTEQHALAEQLRAQALHDPLTGLPNRRFVDAELDRALARTRRSGRCAGLVLCDVDHFKRVNDSFGHPAGDALLVQVGERLRGIVRPTDTVGRLGGDEFVVVCEDVADADELATLTERIHRSLRGVYRVAGTDLAVTVTLGASCGRHTTAGTELLSEADTALYEAKRAGRDLSQVFDQRVHRRTRDRIAREQDLRRALHEGQLTLHVQPVVDLSRLEVVGGEALLRWQHPTEGLLPASSFLDVAEDTELVVELGAWVLRTAMTQAATWPPDETSAIPATLNVNVSGRHLNHPGFLRHLDDALASSGLDPSRVELEVTEAVVLHDLEMTAHVLEGVRSRGVRVALDDFGTGYSSLTWLQRLPVDTVKLDRRFLTGLLGPGTGPGPEVVRGVAALAHALGKRVVAEGVETLEQHDHVVRLGCDLAQGFYYGRPAAGSPRAVTLGTSASDDVPHARTHR